MGKIYDNQFAFLTSGYDKEKTTLTRRIAELTREIDAATERSADVKRFVALVRKYTAIEELTHKNAHELIDRILIHIQSQVFGQREMPSRNIHPFNASVRMRDTAKHLSKMFPKRLDLVLIFQCALSPDGRSYPIAGSLSVLWLGLTIPAVFPKITKYLSILLRLFV